MFVIQDAVHIVTSENDHKTKIFSALMTGRGFDVVQDKNSLIDVLKKHSNKTIEVVLHSDISWNIFRDAYQSVDVAPVVVIKNKNTNSHEGVLISYDVTPFVLQNKISAVNSIVDTAELSYMFMSAMPLVLPLSFSVCVFPSKANKAQKNNSIREISTNGYKSIFFSSESQRVIKDRFPIQAWKLILTSVLPDVKFIGDDCAFVPLRLNNKKQSTTLFVFPERMLPLSRAYYVRAFDLLSSLFDQGVGVSSLIFGPGNSDLDKIQNILKIFTVESHAYPLIRGGFTPVHRAIRKIESYGRKVSGVNTPAPMRFNERNMIFGTKTNSERLFDVIKSESNIRNVIYTGAWFYPAIKTIRNKFPDIKWFCDTHDVFFVVDEYSNKDESRFLYSPSMQKERELNALNNSDGVIAISPSDATSFHGAGINVPIFKESGSFEQASFGVDIANGPRELKFGFIGSGNNNNRNCLKLILNDWWPKILEKMPSAKLVIAGSACKTPESELLRKSYIKSVELLGFVDDLSGFYNSVQIMLSPIIVRGGLNFKSAEALIAGRVLLTNPLGSECLEGVDKGVVVLNDKLDNIDAVVTEILASRARTYRSAVSKSAEKVFGQKIAYSKLVEAVS